MSQNDDLTEYDDEDGEVVTFEDGGDVSDDVDAEDDGDDARLGDNAEDSDFDIAEGGDSSTERNRKKRKKQRELRKKARELAERDLAYLRQQNAELAQRLQAVEGHAVGTSVSQLEAQYAAVQNEIRQAEYIIGKAVEAGNGDDVATAIRLRDDAQMRAAQLVQAKQQVEAARQQITAPRADPRVSNYASEWLKANPWYKPNGGDEDSLVTKAVDNALAAEGWNPATEEYWHELTRRVSRRLGTEGEVAKDKSKKKKAPPMGTDREHAPATSRNEIYISKERKDAMIEAGVWDDPTLRKRYLKAYQSYDRGASR